MVYSGKRAVGVALFTRAWIEIAVNWAIWNVALVALFARAWIEIMLVKLCRILQSSRPLHEGVD